MIIAAKTLINAADRNGLPIVCTHSNTHHPRPSLQFLSICLFLASDATDSGRSLLLLLFTLALLLLRLVCLQPVAELHKRFLIVDALWNVD